MKTISIVTPCYNEEENVLELIQRIRAVMQRFPAYDYEHILIDNASIDRTVAILKSVAAEDKRVKIIVNARNFGHIRSPYYAFRQATGDAVITMASDLQDPPELIADFIHHWEQGARVVVAIKTHSQESWWKYRARGLYYSWVKRFANIELLEHFTGFGLYDRVVAEVLGSLQEPYPYFRGMVAEFGYDIKQVEFTQPERSRGKTSNNFFSLFDMAMLGFTSYSKLPLRLATLAGFVTAVLSLFVGLGYLAYKLMFWNTFSAGIAPVVIGIFFLGSVQLFFMGIVGEYVGAVFTYVQNRPLVVERERINFGERQTPASGGKAEN